MVSFHVLFFLDIKRYSALFFAFRSTQNKTSNMVEQATTTKTSNAILESYRIPGRIVYDGFLPKATEVRGGDILATTEPPAFMTKQQYHWEKAPHLQLVNIPTYDELGKMVMKPQAGLRLDTKSVERFIKTCGILRGKISLEDTRACVSSDRIRLIESAEKDPRILAAMAAGPIIYKGQFITIPIVYREDLREFVDTQNMLRDAWLGGAADTAESVSVVPAVVAASQGLEIQPFHHEGVTVGTHSLWNLICFMFMYDWRASKIGFCACPRCVTPYFLKRRRTQKFCESGTCVAWAASQYSLKWWREKGKKRSEQKTRRRKP